MLKAEATGRRKPEAQARGGGTDSGQPRFEGRVVKELVEPVSRTEAATYVAARVRHERTPCLRAGGNRTVE